MTLSMRDSKTTKPCKPKIPFARQISGQFCQTAVYEIEVEETKKGEGLFQKSSEKRTEEVYRMMARFSDTRWYVCDVFKTTMKDSDGKSRKVVDIKNADFFLNREQALFNLRQHDQKNAGHSKASKLKVVVSDKALGVNHYNAFAAWQKLSFIDKNFSKKEKIRNKANDHVVTDGTFLLSNFNQTASDAVNNIEDYITDMMYFLIDDQLHNLRLSGRDVSIGTCLIKVRISELFDALKQQHEALCQGEEEMSIQNIKDTQDSIKISLDKLIPQEEFSMENISFFKTEFSVLQTYSKCDWSKIPDVTDAFNERYDIIEQEYLKHTETAAENKLPALVRM